MGAVTKSAEAQAIASKWLQGKYAGQVSVMKVVNSNKQGDTWIITFELSSGVTRQKKNVRIDAKSGRVLGE